jgi:CHAT domain-containing protein
LQGIAEALSSRRRFADAATELDRALRIRESLHESRGIADVLLGLAAIDLASRHPTSALERSRRAAEIARTIEAQEPLWQAHTVMGRAYRQLGRRDEARRELEAAVTAVDSLRLGLLPGAAGRPRFLETRIAPFHELVALSVDEGAHVRALELAERAKARVLADVLQQGHADIRGVMTADESREERRLRNVLVGLNQRVQEQKLAPTPDREALDRLEAERERRRREFENFESELYSRRPEVQVQRGGAAPFVWSDVDRLLPNASTVILEYVISEERPYLFVLSRDATGVTLDTLPLSGSAASLAQLARRFRDRVAGRDLAFAADARQLYDVLVAPGAARLAGKTHVIVVPDGPLWEVPFQALRDSRDRYLIESVAVSYVPSLTVLRETLRRQPTRRGDRTVFAMGKADFGSRAAPPTVPLMSDLGPLPDAERQVKAIAELYGADRRATYLGVDAREDRFKAEAPRYSILHLASHGVLDERSPFYSHIVLSPGVGGSSEDGLLEAWELLDVKLDSELVILSACETARGSIAAGEGTLGMTWALFVAGARAAAVSQWKVEAASTTDLMIAFHRRLAASQDTKVEALRRATLEVLANPKYRHPFYWAPFVLVGHPY